MSSTADTPAGKLPRWGTLVGLGLATPVASLALGIALMFVFDLKTGDATKLRAISLAAWLLPLAGLGALGWRRRWVSRPVFIGFLALVGVVSWLPGRLLESLDHHSAEMAAGSNLCQLSAAMDQFKLEHGSGRLFMGRDELVGPDCYVKALNIVRGEDYGPVFPIRYDLGESLSVTLPDGRLVERTEVLAVTMPWGRQVTYPQLDDPDGRKIDGVHTLRFPDGRRYEIAYRGGVPDGPFRAYHADGKPWGEATYERGRVVGPCWRYTGDGRKFDELAPAAERVVDRADERRERRDFRGAEEDYTRAIELAAQGKMATPANQGILVGQCRYKRGHVRRWLADLPGAAEDFRAAIPALVDPGDFINQSDAAAWLFLVQCEQNRRDAAATELAATDKTKWRRVEARLAQFLLGEITEAQLDADVAASRQDVARLKASLYAGLLRRLAGDLPGAFDRLRQARQPNTHDRLLHEVAQHTLDRIARERLVAPKAKRPGS